MAAVQLHLALTSGKTSSVTGALFLFYFIDPFLAHAETASERSLGATRLRMHSGPARAVGVLRDDYQKKRQRSASSPTMPPAQTHIPRV